MFVTNIANNDIGVITPYQAQCGRIRKSLQDFEGIKVGSVEEFQGQVCVAPNLITVIAQSTCSYVGTPRDYHLNCEE